MLARRDTSPASAATTKTKVSLSAGDSEHHPMVSIRKSDNNSNKNKRRFDDQQIRTLESMFEAESRPELQTKQQLANELGLRPRQVAIWFQNKRARSKSKLIEQDYNMLKTSYETLVSKFNSLKRENQCLLIQLQRLRNQMRQLQGSSNCGAGDPRKTTAKEYDNTGTNSEAEQKPNFLLDYNHHEIGVPLCDDSCKNIVKNLGEGEVSEIQNIAKLVQDTEDSTFSSSGNWSGFQSNFEYTCVLDHPSCSSQWWDL